MLAWPRSSVVGAGITTAVAIRNDVPISFSQIEGIRLSSNAALSQGAFYRSRTLNGGGGLSGNVTANRDGMWQGDFAAFPASFGTGSAYNPSGILFVGRAQANTNSNPGSITGLVVPAGVADGDLMLVALTSYKVSIGTTTGWTQLTSASVINENNVDTNYFSLFWRVWHTGDATTLTQSSSPLAPGSAIGFPKAVLRVYRGVSGIDASAQSPTAAGSTATKVSSYALVSPSNTAKVNEWAVFFWSRSNVDVITSPGSLNNQAIDATQWETLDGEKVYTSLSSVLSSDSATTPSATYPFMGYTVTLISSLSATGSVLFQPNYDGMSGGNLT